MSIRTTSAEVQAVLLEDYNGTSDLTMAIRSASAIVDRVAVCAAQKGKTLSSEELTLIETWLAAHNYALSDRIFTQKATGKASGAFAGQYEKGLDATPYGQNAQLIDFSGCLKNLYNQQTAGGVWLGKPPSEQIPYNQRD